MRLCASSLLAISIGLAATPALAAVRQDYSEAGSVQWGSWKCLNDGRTCPADKHRIAMFVQLCNSLC